MTRDELIKKIFFYLDAGYDEEEVADFLGCSVEKVKQLIKEEECK